MLRAQDGSDKRPRDFADCQATDGSLSRAAGSSLGRLDFQLDEGPTPAAHPGQSKSCLEGEVAFGVQFSAVSYTLSNM